MDKRIDPAEENHDPGHDTPRATLKDVALRAGVSRATASRILGDYGYASEDLRIRVKQTAEELNYRANRVARAMRSGHTGVIGFVGADASNRVFGEIVRGVCDEMAAGSYEVLVMNSDLDGRLEQKTIESMEHYPVDGLIIAPATADWSALKRLKAGGIAVVVVDRLGSTPSVELDSVSIDHIRASGCAVEHLLQNGHRRIGMVASVYPHDAPLVNDLRLAVAETVVDIVSPAGARIAGYWRTLEQRLGVASEPLVVSAPVRDTALLEVRLREALSPVAQRPTALVVADTPSLAAVLRVARDLRLDIPSDLSVVTIGSLEWAEFITPGITVVHNPSYEVGRRAAALMMDLLEKGGGEPRQLILDAPLIERDSVARLDAEPLASPASGES